MKIRTGFVSNSSSSSFCIVGFQVDGSPGGTDSELLSNLGFEKSNEEYWNLDYGQQEKDGLLIVGSESPLYVGISIEKMTDVQTLSDYKKKLRSLCGEKKVDISGRKLTLEFGEAGNG